MARSELGTVNATTDDFAAPPKLLSSSDTTEGEAPNLRGEVVILGCRSGRSGKEKSARRSIVTGAIGSGLFVTEAEIVKRSPCLTK